MSRLHKAIEEDDVSEVKYLLAHGEYIEERYGDYKMTPLCLAAMKGRLEIVKLLIEAGADISARDTDGESIAYLAVRSNNVAVIEEVMRAGADASLADNRGVTALAYAAGQNKKDLVAALDTPATPKGQVIFSFTAGDKCLQEIYQFELLERITFIRKGTHGPVEACLREPFSMLEDTTRLREAFAQYAEKGGKRTEAEVFSMPVKAPIFRKNNP